MEIKRKVYSEVTENLHADFAEEDLQRLQKQINEYYVPADADTVMPEITFDMVKEVIDNCRLSNDIDLREKGDYQTTLSAAIYEFVEGWLYDFGDYDVIDQDSYESGEIVCEDY